MVKSADASGDLLPKKIGCMNGMFHLFHRRLLFVGRHHHKRLLAVAGAQQQLDTHNATKAFIEKDPDATSSHPSKHSLDRGLHSSDIRDVVKDSMYREARGVPIKSLAIDGRVSVMKHIDSPRLQVARPRFSYDGRESLETIKTNMKLKELPRFSLDSSMKQQHSLLGCDLHMGNDSSGLVPPVRSGSGSHSRSSSIVTKLMGLEDDGSVTGTISDSKSPTTAARSPTKLVSSPKSVVRNNSTLQSPHQRKTSTVKKTTTCSKLPLEPAPWKKQYQKTGGRNPSSSVYGEIEKRITQLEFKRSGKVLRALKQILEAMQKTRQKSENERLESDELKLQASCSNQKSSSMLQNRICQQPVLITKEACCPKKPSSYTGIAKSTKVKGKVKIPSSSPVPRTQERANHCTPMNNIKKITRRNIESEHSGRGSRMVSPRMQHLVLKTERESRPNTVISEFNRGRKQLSKNVREKFPEKKVKSMNLQLSKAQYSSYRGDTASAKSESSNSATTHVEIDAISSINFCTLNSRKQDYVSKPKQHISTAELSVITMEQPSPVSVLDTTFYIEGSPSPVKKISTAFQEDESSSLDEAEWNLQNLNHITDQKLESLWDLVHGSRSLKNKPNETAATNSETAHQSIIPGHRYITKMLLEYGLLNDAKDNHPILFDDIFNSNILYADEELTKTNDPMKFNQKIHRKVVADAANEILVRKITSDRLLTMGRRMTLQGPIKEVHLEIEHLCRISCSRVDDEDDDISMRVLTVDMKHQSDGSTDYNAEAPALVLDLERLIFKDLITEIITCEVSGECLI